MARGSRKKSTSGDALGPFFDAIEEAALCVAGDGKISRANAAASLLLGYARGALVGLALEGVLPEAVLPEAGDAPAAPGGVADSVQAALHQDGSRFSVEVRQVPLEGPAGAAGGRALLIRPAGSERRHFERRLMSADLLARAQAIAHLGSWESSLSTGRLVWSDETYRIFGHAPGSIQPTIAQFRSQVHPEDLPGLLAAQEAALAGATAYTYEHRIVLPDGSERVVLEQAEIQRDEAGRPVGLTGTVRDRTERRAAEAALRESQTLLALVTNAVPVQISYIGTDLRFRFVNAVYERRFARPLRQILGQAVQSLWSPEAYAILAPHLKRALAGVRADFEVTLPYPDGESRTVHVVYVPDLGPDGAVRGFSTMVEDVTAQRAAEAEMRSSQERLAAVLNLAVDAIISVDQRQRILLFNRGAEEIFGYAAEEVLGQGLERLIPQRFRHSHAGHMADFGSSAQASRRMNERGDLFGLRKDGTEFPAEASISRLETGGEAIYTVIVRDITARKRAEAQVRESEERYRLLVDGSVQGITIQRGRKPLFVNPAYARLFGYESPQEIVALGDLGRLMSPEELARVRIETMASDLYQGGILRQQVTGLRRDGSTVRLEAVSHRVYWQGEAATQTTLVDVTEREQLELQLRQSQKMEAVGQLAGGVAHDFNNMLQVVRGYSELAERRADEPERVQEYMKQVLRAADGGSQLTRQLLAFSRRDQLHTHGMDLNQLLGEVMEMLRRLIPESVDLRLALASEPLPVKVDFSALEQVIVNLCVNARDAMPRGGLLQLRTARVTADASFCTRHDWAKAGPYAVVEVTDTGTGIPADVLTHIFEPFFTTKEPGKGTGLGLSMAYGTLRQLKGGIAVESRPGQGTSFRLYLPLDLDAIQPPAAAASTPVGGGQETILVAEDNPAVLRLVGELLRSRGYRVLIATDGEDAVAMFDTHRDALDLVLLDLVMPKLSGRGVYDHIRAAGAAIPVLFSTGYSATVVDERFVQEHGARMIQKPYRAEELFQRIRDSLDAPAGGSD